MSRRNVILFNPHSRSDRGEQAARQLMLRLGKGDVQLVDMTCVTDYRSFFSQLDAGCRVIVCGGDGTLNRFLNDIAGMALPASLCYYAAGSGNDFCKDIGQRDAQQPVELAPYIQNLPQVSVGGNKLRFLTGVGCGLDGHCCVVADRARMRGFRKIPYVLVAFLGLLYQYKPSSAEVTVDGVTTRYEKVWMMSAMKGRYFGGGIKITPDQSRSDPEGLLSAVVISGCGRLRIMTLFPSIFKAKHLQYTQYVHVVKGHEITMRFDRPVSAQVDGETFVNVQQISASSAGFERL